ncbi:hypothetical protein F4779DRAFT_269416 [Xylariaceae sp. FL0662B]|nr:hypothetical protein F4779DRAFT_269416 [Xylariaceae sp. FL0662B]
MSQRTHKQRTGAVQWQWGLPGVPRHYVSYEHRHPMHRNHESIKRNGHNESNERRSVVHSRNENENDNDNERNEERPNNGNTNRINNDNNDNNDSTAADDGSSPSPSPNDDNNRDKPGHIMQFVRSFFAMPAGHSELQRPERKNAEPKEQERASTEQKVIRQKNPGWHATIKGLARPTGCSDRQHWALAYESYVDISKLPPRVAGIRTRIQKDCRTDMHRRKHEQAPQNTGWWRRYYGPGGGGGGGDDDDDDESPEPVRGRSPPAPVIVDPPVRRRGRRRRRPDDDDLEVIEIVDDDGR